MKITLSAVIDGRTVTVTARPIDVVAFERKFEMGIAKAFHADHMRVESAMWLLWHALSRDGEVGDFNEWLETVEEFGEGEVAPSVPLAEGQPIGT